MMEITIIAVGKMKTAYYRQAVDEYLKRLRPYAKIREIELRPTAFSASGKTKSIREEIAGLRAAIRKLRDPKKVFLLKETGEKPDTEGFANLLSGPDHFVFVIGGALGFGREKPDFQIDREISLSALTFPHELARVVLVEQIYRSAAIKAGKEYHY